jgi:FAD/FMN-containing dehydrogenase
MQLTTTTGRPLPLDSDAMNALRSRIRGRILTDGDGGYDEARTIWNAMIQRRPGAILQPAGIADIMRAVAFAGEQDVLLSVRGGGHHIAGNAVTSGGLMIDLSGMRSVRVDPASRRAFVQPGARLADFDAEAQAFALATPLGINSTTGVAGLALGGGFGWLTRRFGLTADNLLAADVVTADGRLVRATPETHGDLYWALRGGGGNFGVVVNFEFQLHPVGPDVFAGLIVFPGEDARTLLARYREFAASIPDTLNVWAVLRKAPPLPFLPAAVHGKDVLIFPVFYAGGPEEGTRLVDPVRRFGTPIGEHTGPVPYAAWQQAFDPLLTPGARNYWKSHNFTHLSDGALDCVTSYARELPSSQCEIFIGLLGGEAGRVPVEATAYAQRDANFVMNVHGRWESPVDDTACTAWARAFFTAAAPFSNGGGYVNFMTEEEGDRVAAAYGSNYARLAQVKNRYDPANLFRLNHNISPQASSRALAT